MTDSAPKACTTEGHQPMHRMGLAGKRPLSSQVNKGKADHASGSPLQRRTTSCHGEVQYTWFEIQETYDVRIVVSVWSVKRTDRLTPDQEQIGIDSGRLGGNTGVLSSE